MKRVLVAGSALILLFLATACRKNNGQDPLSAEQTRRIEVLIRSQYDIPADYQLTFGRRVKSTVPDYYDLPVTFSHAGKQVGFTFLLSRDGQHLARLQEFDLTKDPSVAIPLNSRTAWGDPGAKVTIVVYDDLACPYCARFYAELFPDTVTRYKRLVRIVFKDYPLTQVHPWAMHAAVDAGCLAAQNTAAYWEYLSKVHSRYADFPGEPQRLSLSFKRLDELAKKLGGRAVDQAALGLCLQRQDDSAIQASMQEGDTFGIQSTPTIFVNGERIVGARPISWLRAAVDRALKAEGLEPPTNQMLKMFRPATTIRQMLKYLGKADAVHMQQTQGIPRPPPKSKTTASPVSGEIHVSGKSADGRAGPEICQELRSIFPVHQPDGFEDHVAGNLQAART